MDRKRHSEQSSALPPTKRRRFFIEDILELSSQSGSGMPNYIQELDSSVQHIAKFKTTSCRSKFMIKQLPADPEQLLRELFRSVVDSALEKSKQNSVNPTHLGCIISSAKLDSDVYIPLRQMTPNTIDSILNRFLQVGQSKKKDGTSLFGEPFTITVTTLDRNGLKGNNKIAGSGRRMHAAVHHRVKENNLIKV